MGVHMEQGAEHQQAVKTRSEERKHRQHAERRQVQHSCMIGQRPNSTNM